MSPSHSTLTPGADIMEADDRQLSSDDSFHSPTVIPPSALDKPSIMKHYHRRWTTRWGVTARSPTLVMLHDIRFLECRWWNDGWTVKTVVTWRSSTSMIPAPEQPVQTVTLSRQAPGRPDTREQISNSFLTMQNVIEIPPLWQIIR